MAVGVPNRPAHDGDQRADEIEARIAEARRELAELYALRGAECTESPRASFANLETGVPHEPLQSMLSQSRAGRFIRTSRDVLRQVFRSPMALFTDVERYFARSKHQPQQWTTSSAGRIAVEDQLQDVWPLNVEIRTDLTPTLNVLLPSLCKQDLTGGPNTALNLTYRLAARGVPVRYIATDRELDSDEQFLHAHLRAVSGIETAVDDVQFLSGRNRGRALVLGADDVLCGTAWWTAQMIKQIQPRLNSQRFLYLIQDFEPAMYAWSTKQALALETYGLDFQGIICGRLLADYLSSERVGRFADPGFLNTCATFEPAVDPDRFAPRFDAIARRKKRLLFYARPQAPRNLFEMGLVALKQAAALGAFPPAEWELGFLGAEDLPSADLGGGVLVKSHPWRDYDAYARLLQSADVGLSLMLSPHTSYPPLEMAACGATVVTNTFSVKTAERLQSMSPNLLPVEPRVEDIVTGLLAAVARADELPERFAGAMLDVPANWDAALDPVLPQIYDMWNANRGR